ncbi:YceI family protein [Oleiagrimonas citrea]|uniref:YceI family protein n=1 Tax=Oleiagrimonas citrea TaxID=1665687 RepID=A0A846ZPJ8_9GAMM|nr:YceI family protein [Oleiagrimonas citrea]NKZ40144.1 YceI family protein [Oleiagrimonas citrea]
MYARALKRSSRCFVALATLFACATLQATPATTLHIDRGRSHAAFSVRLIWWQSVIGRFDDVRGQIRIDPVHRTARVQARIRAESVRVKPSRYRKRLLGKHFFDAGTYPDITFTSDPIPLAQLHRDHERLKGHITLHGVTRPMTLRLYDTQCPGQGFDQCTLHLRGWLDRTHFGMRAYRAFVSSRVNLSLVIRLRAESEPSPSPLAPHRTDTR